MWITLQVKKYLRSLGVPLTFDCSKLLFDSRIWSIFCNSIKFLLFWSDKLFPKYIRRKRSNFKQRNFYFSQFISKWNRKTQNSGEKLKTVAKNSKQWRKTQNSGGKLKTVAEKIKPWRKFFFATYVFRKISYSMSSESWVPQARLICTTRCAISHFRCSYNNILLMLPVQAAK